MWEGELCHIPTRRNDLANGLVKAYALIWDQCSQVMRSKLEQFPIFRTFDAAKDPIQLLTEMRNIVCGREAHMQDVWSLCQQIKLLVVSYQENNETNEKYFERFNGMWEALIQQGGNLTAHPGLTRDRAQEIAGAGNAVTQAHMDEAQAQLDEEMKAAFMLSGANSRRHKKLKRHLEDAFTMGRNEYPANTTALLSMMNSFRGIDEDRLVPRHAGASDEPDDGLNFMQQGNEHPERKEGNEVSSTKGGVNMFMKAKAGNKAPPKQGTREREEKLAQCMHCGAAHDLADCPDITTEQLGEILIQLEGLTEEQGNMMFQEGEASVLKKNFLYLDTCTTEDQMIEPSYLRDIRTADKALTLHTNAGSSRSTKQGRLGSMMFWLDEGGIANVVSLRSLESRFHVRYDSKEEGGSFICDMAQGQITFKRCPKTGFPYVDLDAEHHKASVALVQCIRKNYEGYTKEEVKRAIDARKAQARTGHPSEAKFKKEVSRTSNSSLFRDCSFTPKDISNARAIFGPSLPCTQGKWVRRTPERVEPVYVTIPAQLISINRYVTLAADVMFVSGLPFFVTLSRRVRYVTVQFVPRRTAAELANCLKQVITVYRRAGFICCTALMDGEFEKVKKKVIDCIEVNITARNEHVPEIERKIRVIKERARCYKADMPVKELPSIIIKRMVLNAVLFLNAYVDKQGISEEYSP